jgi:hypothetical protein
MEEEKMSARDIIKADKLHRKSGEDNRRHSVEKIHKQVRKIVKNNKPIKK